LYAIVTQGCWYLGWASWTRPRLPTIWKSFAGSLVVTVLPFVHLVRGIAEWCKGFEDAPDARK